MDGDSKKRKRKSLKAGRMSGAMTRGWKDVTPAADDNLGLLVGSEEGGFLSLEEIDADVYNAPGSWIDVPTPSTQEVPLDVNSDKRVLKSQNKKKKLGRLELPISTSIDGSNASKFLQLITKSKKRKKIMEVSSNGSKVEPEGNSKEDSEALFTQKKCKMGSRARKAKRLKQHGFHGSNERPPADEQVATIDQVKTQDGELIEGTSELSEESTIDISAWKEMRLHPLLEKAIETLGFPEPTPIQKACIPAAAHKGKDVIGAAETGSGKTLAFGLPILQRLLEENEKTMATTTHQVNSPSKENKKVLYQGQLRALIVTPTRELALQICEHLRAAAKFTSIRVVPIVGGMAPQKQQRLLKQKPEIIVGTPGRLWELMSSGESHLLEVHALSFFVLDEADRMVEKGHFKELQSIIDLLPSNHKGGRCTDDDRISNEPAEIRNPRKRRQTLVFSATLALPPGLKNKLKRGKQAEKVGVTGISSVEALSERAGVSHEAAVVDLTSSRIVAGNLSESVVECTDQNKDHYLYYILKVHGCGRTIVFCTSIAALRRISALLRLLQVPVWPLHAQMQQKQRLKAMDRFRGNQDCVLVATDVAARGLDIPGIRTVIHYQLPHSAEIYVHRSGRTARASTDGCSISLVSPSDRAKYVSLCGALKKIEGLPDFPIDVVYMPAIEKRVLLAINVDKVMRQDTQSRVSQAWLARSAKAMEITLEDSDEDGKDNGTATFVSKSDALKLRILQKELHELLNQPLEPKAFSRRYITGSGISSFVTKQLQDYIAANARRGKKSTVSKKGRLVVIGQKVTEPLEALHLSFTSPQAKKFKRRR